MTTHALMELADRLEGVSSWLSNVDPAHEKAQGALSVGIAELDAIATQLRTAAAEGGDETPDAWIHTLNMEGGQTTSNLTFRKKHNFGRRGVDYDPSYTVTSQPLYLHPPTDSGAPALYWNGATTDGVAIGPSVSKTKNKWHDIPLYRQADSGAGRDGEYQRHPDPVAERVGDMGEGTKLQLFREDDGDFIVSVMPEKHRLPEMQVQFCVPGSGGGSSRATWDALCALHYAMHQDAMAGAAGEKGCG